MESVLASSSRNFTKMISLRKEIEKLEALKEDKDNYDITKDDEKNQQSIKNIQKTLSEIIAKGDKNILPLKLKIDKLESQKKMIDEEIKRTEEKMEMLNNLNKESMTRYQDMLLERVGKTAEGKRKAIDDQLFKKKIELNQCKEEHVRLEAESLKKEKDEILLSKMDAEFRGERYTPTSRTEKVYDNMRPYGFYSHEHEEDTPNYIISTPPVNNDLIKEIAKEDDDTFITCDNCSKKIDRYNGNEMTYSHCNNKELCETCHNKHIKDSKKVRKCIDSGDCCNCEEIVEVVEKPKRTFKKLAK